MGEYICRGCGKSFREPVWNREPPLEQPDHMPGEGHRVSPCCGEDFLEGVRCAGCGRPIEEGSLCSRCRDQAAERFRTLLEEFTPEEREALNELYDGVPLT